MRNNRLYKKIGWSMAIIISVLFVWLIWFGAASIRIDKLDQLNNYRHYKVIYLVVEGLDYNFYLAHQEFLPNLSALYSQALIAPRPMDAVASFYFLATGGERSQIWPSLNNNYQVNWEQPTDDYGQSFWQQAREHGKTVWRGDINWLVEQQLRTTDFTVDDILLAAQNEFIGEKQTILEMATEFSQDVLVAKLNYLVNVGHFLAEPELLLAYQEVDELVGELNGRLGRNELLFVVSPFGQQSVEYLVNLNNVLSNKGWLKYSGQQFDFGVSYAYSLVPGQISINIKGRENRGFVSEENVKEVMEDVAFSSQTIDDPVNDQLVELNIFAIPTQLGQQTELTVGLPIGYGLDFKDDVEKIKLDVKENDSSVINDYWGISPDLVPGAVFSTKEIVGQLTFYNLFEMMCWLLKI